MHTTLYLQSDMDICLLTIRRKGGLTHFLLNQKKDLLCVFYFFVPSAHCAFSASQLDPLYLMSQLHPLVPDVPLPTRSMLPVQVEARPGSV